MVDRDCCFNASIGSTRDARQAGSMPNATQVAVVTATAKPIARQSRSPVTRFNSCICSGVTARMTSSNPLASQKPSAQPSSASTTLSIAASRSNRARPAPIAAIKANSPARLDARTSIRLVTLTHATSNRTLTAPRRRYKDLAESRPTRTCTGTSVTRYWPLGRAPDSRNPAVSAFRRSLTCSR